MLKNFIIPVASLFILSAFTFSVGSHTISGQISFPGEGEIYVYLMTQDEHSQSVAQDEHTGNLWMSPRFLIIRPTPEQYLSGRAPFKFEGIPQGEYYIDCYQDGNANGKLDHRAAGSTAAPQYNPAEPWGTYRNTPWGGWYDLKFEVREDLSDVSIRIG